MKNRKQLLLIVLSLMIVFSSAFVYGAEVDKQESPISIMRMVAGGDLSFTRLGDKKGQLEVYCQSSMTADYIKATCTVQKLNTSTARYYDYGNTFEIKDTDTSSLLERRNLTVDTSGTYRVKVIFEDKVNGIITKTNAYYTQAVGL
ncbi:MAG: hypothetical protein VB095_01510 [Anaerovorax sp.]|nr:hypothetical protein [Anaerovorax sp.]